jgi:hypothetical protein
MRAFLLVVGEVSQEQVMRQLHIHHHLTDVGYLDAQRMSYLIVGSSSEAMLPNITTYEDVPQPICALLPLFNGNTALKLTPDFATQIENCFTSSPGYSDIEELHTFLKQHEGKLITSVDI